MGVYIKGMEIPKSCGECLDIGWHYVFDCRLDDAEEGERLPNCPLVPIPPHGDLIDRDPFIEFIKTNLDSYDQWFVEQLEARPTIIKAEGEE